MKGVTKELVKSLKSSMNRDDNKTTFQIRIYDDKTGKACYKYLTSVELKAILTMLDKEIEWLY